MRRAWLKRSAIFVPCIAVFSLMLLYAAQRESQAPPVATKDLSNDELQDLVSSVLKNVDITNWPQLSPTKIDVAHMHGSWLFGDVLALRLHGITVEPREIMANSSGDLSASDIHKNYRGDAGSPDWLVSPWLDSDGSPAHWGQTEMRAFSATIIWYTRPKAQEVIIYITSDDSRIIPASIHTILSTVSYSHIQCGGFVGDDWREWGRVRLERIP